jgi:hypothetical protein
MLPDRAPEVDLEGLMIFESVKARLFGSVPEPTRIGEHEVLRRLGAGGMGEVYLAWNPELRRLEAVKVLRTSRGGEDGAQQRLLQEARALARLSHPNVVQVYRGDATAGDVYIAMEYIEGPTLDVWQRQARRTWTEILQVYIAAGHGLAAAHHVGLVHRDFKPKSRRSSPNAPQPTDRPHSHDLGRFERVGADHAAPVDAHEPQLLAKRWQWTGPTGDPWGIASTGPAWMPFATTGSLPT